MRKPKVLYSFLVILMFSQPLDSYAQESWCGTMVDPKDIPEILQRTAAFPEKVRPLSSPSGHVYFRVQHHIVRLDDGTGGIDPAILDLEMAAINAAFASSGIQFHSCSPIHYLNSNKYYGIQTDNDDRDDLVEESFHVEDAINLYHVGNIDLFTRGLGTYPWQNRQYVILAHGLYSNPADYNPLNAIHEFGHFFGLHHTFEDQDFGPECVDGSNCSSAGDLICDTPASPPDGLSASNVTNCIYDGIERDPPSPTCNNDPYNPDVGNYMDYALQCFDHFTAGQRAVMIDWKDEPERTVYLLEDTDLTGAIGSTVVNSGLVHIEDAYLTGSADVDINACVEVIIEGPFSVPVGATLNIDMD